MNRRWTVACTALAVFAGQPSATGPCDTIAARIRANRDVVSGASQDDPLVPLHSGSTPFIVLGGSDSLDLNARPDSAERSAFTRRFAARFAPTLTLAAAVRTILDTRQPVAVYAAPRREVFAVETWGGTASCVVFQFFRMTPARTAEPIGSPPAMSDHICENFGMAGYLATVGTDVAWLEYEWGRTENRYRIAVTPWRNARWQPACAVSVDFRNTHAPARVLLSPNAAIDRATASATAVRLADRVFGSDTSIAVGDPVPAADRSAATRMVTLAIQQNGAAVPAFGATSQLESGQETLSNARTHTFVVEGRVVVARIGHAAIGWREYPQLIAVFYVLRSGALDPIATVIVDQHRGALTSLAVTALR